MNDDTEARFAELLDHVKVALVILESEGEGDSPLAAFLRAAAKRAEFA